MSPKPPNTNDEEYVRMRAFREQWARLRPGTVWAWDEFDPDEKAAILAAQRAPDSSKSSQGLGDGCLRVVEYVRGDELLPGDKIIDNHRLHHVPADSPLRDPSAHVFRLRCEPIPEREALAEARKALEHYANRPYPRHLADEGNVAKAALAALPSPPEQTADEPDHLHGTVDGCAWCESRRRAEQVSTPAEPTKDLRAELAEADGDVVALNRMRLRMEGLRDKAKAEAVHFQRALARVAYGFDYEDDPQLAACEMAECARAALSTPPSTPQEKP
jgi:hypothetical protein